MNFLETESGTLLAHAVILIERAQTREGSKQLFHRVHFAVGADARETWARSERVDEFLE